MFIHPLALSEEGLKKTVRSVFCRIKRQCYLKDKPGAPTPWNYRVAVLDVQQNSKLAVNEDYVIVTCYIVKANRYSRPLFPVDLCQNHIGDSGGVTLPNALAGFPIIIAHPLRSENPSGAAFSLTKSGIVKRVARACCSSVITSVPKLHSTIVDRELDYQWSYSFLRKKSNIA